jgi:hypothetical protein
MCLLFAATPRIFLVRDSFSRTVPCACKCRPSGSPRELALADVSAAAAAGGGGGGGGGDEQHRMCDLRTPKVLVLLLFSRIFIPLVFFNSRLSQCGWGVDRT